MAEQNFVDYVKICCRSGAGGSGASHFHRDKTTAFGGPDGGDGGRGGHIILRGNSNEWTLLSLKYKKHITAGNGVPGAGGMKNGAFGHDVYLEVPLGTVARDAETGEIEFEITAHGEEQILVPGGRGGLGNAHFKSSTKQSPEYAQKGDPGLEEWKILELKVLADVGLVGFPNAGKSSLLAAMSAAKPEIANYPFTTLVPNLGIVRYRNTGSYIMADIPGIIEEAHQGRGLGLRFLRHIERNSMLLFMVPADTEDINKAYQVLLYELKMYNPDLLEKPRLLAISKNDLIDEEIQQWIEKDLKVDVPYLFISAVAEKGLTELNDTIWRMLHEG